MFTFLPTIKFKTFSDTITSNSFCTSFSLSFLSANLIMHVTVLLKLSEFCELLYVLLGLFLLLLLLLFFVPFAIQFGKGFFFSDHVQAY